MNRLKLWLYMLVVLGAGVANSYLITIEGEARALQEADAALATGATAHRARERLMASQAAAVTALAVKDEALLEALAAGPRPEPKKKGKAEAPVNPEVDAQARHEASEAAARTAVDQAAAALGFELPSPAFWLVTNAERLARAEADPEGPQKEAQAFLREAARGTVRRGYARVNDGLWYGVAMPAGTGSALALFLPVDAAWATALKAESGCDVTIDAGTPQLLTTAPAAQAKKVLDAARISPGRPVGQGLLGKLQLTSPLRIEAPILFARPPAQRALAVELPGIAKGVVVLSRPTAGAFTPLAHYQWVTFEVLAGLLLVGLLLGVLVKTEVLPQVPPQLVAAAAKIERGDFAARAPEYLGALGTLASALNKAAETAQVAQAPAPHVDPFAAPAPAAEPPEPHFDFWPGPPPPPAPVHVEPAPVAPPPAPEAKETTQRLDGPAQFAGGTAQFASGTTQPAGGTAQPAFATDSFAARPVPRAAAPAMTAAGLTAVGMPAVTAPTTGAGAEEDEDTHWRAVHAEFLEVRTRCGESVDNLGYDRFRPKLEKNKEALIQKYGCRAVRFSVYVKDGKAALKATPVK
jgi:hypothetical protein